MKRLLSCLSDELEGEEERERADASEIKRNDLESNEEEEGISRLLSKRSRKYTASRRESEMRSVVALVECCRRDGAGSRDQLGRDDVGEQSDVRLTRRDRRARGKHVE